MSGEEAFLLPRLQKALAFGGYTHDFQRDVVPLLVNQRAQCWTKGDGIIITEVLNFPNHKAVNFWLVAGRLDDTVALEPEIIRWARTQGCARAIGIGRKGWIPALTKIGYRAKGIAFEKGLTQ